MDVQVPWLRSGTGQTPADGGCIMQVVDWIHRGSWTDDPPCVHPIFRRLAINLNDRLDDGGRQRLLDLAPRLMGTASDDKTLSVRLAIFAARRVLPLVRPGEERPRLAIEAAEAWCDNPCAETQAEARSASYAAYAAYASDAAAASYAAYASDAADAADAAYAADAAASYAASHAADAAYAAAAAYAAYADAAAASADAASYASDAADAAASDKTQAIWDLLIDTLDEYDRLTGRTKTEDIDWTPVCSVMTPAKSGD